MLRVKFESNINGVVEEIDDWENFSVTTIRETLDLQPDKFGKVKLINISLKKKKVIVMKRMKKHHSLTLA